MSAPFPENTIINLSPDAVRDTRPHHEHELYTANTGSFAAMPPLPLPPVDGMTVKVNTYEDVPEEPRFDPAIHLDLQRPEWVRLLGENFKKTTDLPQFCPEKGSTLAYTAPFKVVLHIAHFLKSVYFAYSSMCK